jgi:hypothetical protein
MKWILVVVGIFNGGAEVNNEGVYDTMEQCFYAREEIIWEYFGNVYGQPPINFQVVCIPTDKYI